MFLLGISLLGLWMPEKQRQHAWRFHSRFAGVVLHGNSQPDIRGRRGSRLAELSSAPEPIDSRK